MIFTFFVSKTSFFHHSRFPKTHFRSPLISCAVGAVEALSRTLGVPADEKGEPKMGKVLKRLTERYGLHKHMSEHAGAMFGAMSKLMPWSNPTSRHADPRLPPEHEVDAAEAGYTLAVGSSFVNFVAEKEAERLKKGD